MHKQLQFWVSKIFIAIQKFGKSIISVIQLESCWPGLSQERS